MSFMIGTGNPHKFKELSELMAAAGIEWHRPAKKNLPHIEEDGHTFEANAAKKALGWAQAAGCWVLADDSGIEVDALDGAPGIRSARYAGKHGDDEANNDYLLERMRDVPADERTARYQCALVLASPERVELSVQAAWEGLIAYERRGKNGFGYDPLFYLPEFGVTSAELPPRIKQTLSHRAAAARLMCGRIKADPSLGKRPKNR